VVNKQHRSVEPLPDPLRDQLQARNEELTRINDRLEAKVRELEIANEDLANLLRSTERASRAKSRFLAAAGHDLRQPLQTLSLLNSVLAQRTSGMDAETGEAVQRQADGVAAMHNLLNLFMDLIRLERGAIRPEISEFAVEDLLQKIDRQFGAVASSRRIGLRTIPSSARVHSDPALLYRIVENLVSNALRYTVAGRVVVGCRRRGDRLRIEVLDTGPGIPDDRQEIIFEEFVQVSKPRHQAEKGYGLGLSVSKNLADVLKVSLGVRSTLGKGSVFSVEVPLAGKSPAASASDERKG
jgi:signal transduction histidine kinase